MPHHRHLHDHHHRRRPSTLRFAAAPLAMAMLVLGVLAAPARGQNIPIHQETLENGVTVLIVPRPSEPGRIAAGWALQFGASDVPAGMSGATKLIESMLQGGVPEIGTRDISAERTIMAEQDSIAKKMNDIIANEQMPRVLAGEIDDPIDPRYDTEELAAFRQELGQLVQRQFSIAEPNAFNDLYQEAGLLNMAINAGADYTLLGAILPANAVEFWAWMESERLRNPVFRGFYIERARLWEERRTAIRENPLIARAEDFNQRFWGDSPYGASIEGDPTDLARLLRPEVRALFEQYMRPERLTVAIVGDVDVEQGMAIARTYFGRLEPSAPSAAPPMDSAGAPCSAEPVEVEYEHAGPNVIEVRAHTVPFGHADDPAMQVLAGLVNDRWLSESLVQAPGSVVAGGAAAHVARSNAGHFTLTVEAPPGVEMEALAEATLAFVASFADREITQAELDRAVRNIIATGYRRMQRNDVLLNQLLAFSTMGDGELLNTLPSKLRAVTADDIHRIADAYLSLEDLSIARYHGTGPAVPQSVEELPPQLRAQVEPLLAQIQQETDVNRLRGMAAQFQGIMAEAPDQVRTSLQFLLSKVEQRIAELGGSGGSGVSGGDGAGAQDAGPPPAP